jgi:hypothetical protein
MKTSRAFWAGVIGAILITFISAIGRAVGLPVNFEMILGSLVAGAFSPSAWLVGLILHLCIGGLLGLLYAVGFERVTHQAGGAAGLLFGTVHTVFSGLALGVLPAIHPAMPEIVRAPGMFMSSYGAAAVLAFLALHLLFGAYLGAAYAPVLHPVPRHAAHSH